MKKVIFLIISIMIANKGHTAPIQYSEKSDLALQLEDAYIKIDGILALAYAHFKNITKCKNNSYLYFRIIIDQKTDISTPEREEINRILRKSFLRKYHDLQMETCNFPEKPEIHSLSDHVIEKPRPDLGPLLGINPDERWVAEQKMTISRDNEEREKINIEAENVHLYRDYLDDQKSESVILPSTFLKLSGELDIPDIQEPKQNLEKEKKRLIKENRAAAAYYDSLITVFKKENEQLLEERMRKKLSRNFYYVDLNRDIFYQNIQPLLDIKIEPWAAGMLENFTSNFLGNADLFYFNEIPINPDIDSTRRDDLVPAGREQDPNIRSNENYSLFSVSASKKSGMILENYDIKISDFRHMVTIKDSSLHEVLITYPSKKYKAKIESPLKSKSLFGDTLGQKFSDDIIRFFYGFTTALTIQDISWLERYYHDLATRSFFPYRSDSRYSNRVTKIGAKDILERYQALKDAGREIYVTLNADEESKIENRKLFVWVSLKHKQNREFETLAVINEKPALAKMMREAPAYLLSLEMLQKWTTVDRFTQIPRLYDDAIVEFTLLCLNINRLLDWLGKNEFEQLTAITVGSYLYDLGNDMYPNEWDSLKMKYPALHTYMKKNVETMERIKKYREGKKRKAYKKAFGYKKHFEKIRKELPGFIHSSLRVNAHNRRFLFNACYLKIIYQYTYDNYKGLTQEPRTEFSWIAKEFQGQFSKKHEKTIK